MRAVIIAGGEGRRLRPATLTVPKPLIPVGDIPILHIILSQLKDAGFTHVTLSLGYGAETIKASLDGDRWNGMDLAFSFEKQSLGTAGPLSLLPRFEDSTLVMNSDLLTDIDFGDLWRRHKKSDAAATIALSQQNIDVVHGVVELDENQRVVDFREKPRISYLVSGGIYVLEPRLHDLLRPAIRRDMPELLEYAQRMGERIEGYVLDGDWRDIGTPEQLQRADEAFRTDRARYLRSTSGQWAGAW